MQTEKGSDSQGFTAPHKQHAFFLQSHAGFEMAVRSREVWGYLSDCERACAPPRFCLPARAGGPTSPRLPTAHRSHTQSEETHAEGLKHAY